MMKPFTAFEGRAVPLDRANVDTDAIIPKQYLKSIKRVGFGPFLFDDWRYLDPGDLGVDPATRRVNSQFVLNRPEHAGATILLTRENFGCGSSREHAVWALSDYGFRAVLAPSFADIFYDNCLKNGLLPVVLSSADIQVLFDVVARDPTSALALDLSAQQVRVHGYSPFHFDIDIQRKDKLLQGLDEIGETLQHAEAIRAYEARRSVEAPWVFVAKS